MTLKILLLMIVKCCWMNPLNMTFPKSTDSLFTKDRWMRMKGKGQKKEYTIYSFFFLSYIVRKRKR
jgi:hypothetical protein